MNIHFNELVVKTVRTIMYIGLFFFVLYLLTVLFFVFNPDSTLDLHIITDLVNISIKVNGVMFCVLGFYAVMKMLRRNK